MLGEAGLLGVTLRAGMLRLADPPPPWLPPIAGWKEAKLCIAKALAGVSAGATLSAIARKPDLGNMAISCGMGLASRARGRLDGM